MPTFSIDELTPPKLFTLIDRSLFPSSIDPTTMPLLAAASSIKIVSICFADKAIFELFKSISIFVS